MTLLRGAATALGALAACSQPAVESYPPITYGNPPGYAVYHLSGEGLTSPTVAVNGVSIDTWSEAAIDASVAAMAASTHAPTSVEEVSGLPADLRVDFTAPAAPVPPTFYGANLQWRSKFFLTLPRWRKLVSHLRLDILRFPGGQERSRYDGAASLAGTVAEDQLTVTADQPYEYRLAGDDVAHFIQLCRDLGIAAEPKIDVTIDDAGMWTALVRQIVDDLGYDLRYVSVGNEPDIASPNGNWPYLGGTPGDQSTAPVALANYVDRYLRYAAALDAVQPGLTYALGELAVWQGGEEYPPVPYMGTVLARLGGNQPGALAAHWYMLGNQGQAASDPSYPSVEHLVVSGNADHDVAYLARIASALRADAAAAGLASPKLFLGEWGASWSATAADAAFVDRLATALFSAEAQEYGKLQGFDSMQWYGLSDPTAFTNWVPSMIAVDDAGELRVRPVYYVYLMYRYFYGDHIVPVPGGQTPAWSIYASSDASRAYLMLINRTAARRFSKVVSVKTAAGERQLRLTLYPHAITVVRM